MSQGGAGLRTQRTIQANVSTPGGRFRSMLLMSGELPRRSGRNGTNSIVASAALLP